MLDDAGRKKDVSTEMSRDCNDASSSRTQQICKNTTDGGKVLISSKSIEIRHVPQITKSPKFEILKSGQYLVDMVINSEGSPCGIISSLHWEGPGSDLKVCPAGSGPAAFGKLVFCPFGIEVENHGFQTACLITGEKFHGVGLKLKALVLSFWRPIIFPFMSEK